MKKNHLLPILLLSSLLASCGSTDDTGSEEEAIDITSFIDDLRLGFKMEGTLVITETYYDDSSFQIPSSSIEEAVTTYEFAFVYENAEDFTGVDRRFYSLEEDEEGNATRSYVMGENAYDDDGYAGIMWLDYDNSVVEGYAVDSNGDRVPYGTNGLLNPFTLTRYDDFSGNGGAYSLSATKAEIVATNWFSTLDEWQDNLTYEDASFEFDADGLVSAHLLSNAANTSSTVTVKQDGNYLTAYVSTTYEATISFSEAGTASSRALVTPAEEKEENEPLANALESMAGEEIILKRQITPYQDGEYVGYDSCANFYYMGEDKGIYSQSYFYYEGDSEPTAPSSSDFLLYTSTSGGYLRVYQLDDTTSKFVMNSSDFSHLDNLYTYDDLAYDISYLSANIFTLNEDGSFTPNEDNIPYIAREVFMSNLDTFTPVDSGYVNDVKIYVNEDETCIDYVLVAYADNSGNHGTMTLTYDGLGTGTPSFDIEIDE